MSYYHLLVLCINIVTSILFPLKYCVLEVFIDFIVLHDFGKVLSRKLETLGDSNVSKHTQTLYSCSVTLTQVFSEAPCGFLGMTSDL